MDRGLPTRLSLVAAAVILAGRSPAGASTVTSMDTETLVRLSAVIVRGEVQSASVALEKRGDIQTWVTIRVDESLKGAMGQAQIAVSVPGGTWEDRVSQVFGAPRFQLGERVLVFATPTKAGQLTVTGLFQGKFHVENEEALQDGGGGAAVVGPGTRPRRERLAPFLERIRELAGRNPGPALAPAAIGEPPAGAIPTESFTLLPLLPFRYFEPDDGIPVTFMFNVSAAPIPAAGAQAGFAAARQNWTDVTGATVAVGDGGSTTQTCRVLFDGSVISHGDPCGQMPPFDPGSCSGVLAITGVSGFTTDTRTVNGVSFLRMTEADTVFNASTECFYAGPFAQKNYEEVLTHEMGHGLGLGHSCGDAYTPACAPGTEADDALMAAFAHGGGRGGTPHADDVDGIRFIYPPPGFIDLKLNQAAFATGQAMHLTTDVNGTASADFYLVLVYPDRSFVSLAPGLPRNVLVPTDRNVPLHFLKNVPLFNHTFGGSEPVGSYYWVTILVRAGTSVQNTANWLSSDYAVFTFAP